MAGANVHALVTGLTLLLVHLGHAVDDVDSVKGTGLLTGAQTQAAVGAAQITAARQLGSSHTVVETHIVVLLVVLTAAGAVDLSDHLDGSAGSHAHDLADLSGNRITAGSAGVDRSGALHHSGSIAGAAGEAAAAAVGAGQAAQNGLLPGVHLNGEHLGGNGQDQAEDGAQHSQDHNGKDNSIHIHDSSASLNQRPSRPAAIRAMGKPSKALGHLENSIRSRMEAKITMTRRKPIPPVTPYTTLVIKS